MHERLRPRHHKFVYPIFTWLFDLDRLGRLDGRLRLFSVERANLFSFYNADHGARDGSDLRPWVEAELEKASVDRKASRICLLAMPRFLGYVFNPLSIYYCFDADERLFAAVYEVKNTFGEQHVYVLTVDESSGKANTGYRHQCDKDFYVSPFIEAKATYHFRLNVPRDDLRVFIREEIESGLLLIATLTGIRRKLTDGELVRQAFRHPFLTYKVIASIHIQALKLWLKGIRLQPRNTKKSAEIGLSSDSSSVTNLVEEPPGSM